MHNWFAEQFTLAADFLNTHLFESWLNRGFSPKSKQVSHPSPWCVTVIHTDTISVIFRSQHNERLSQVTTVTFTYFHSNTEKKSNVDWSVQTQVKSCRAHVTGSNFAQHARVVPVGIIKKKNWNKTKPCHLWVKSQIKHNKSTVIQTSKWWRFLSPFPFFWNMMMTVPAWTIAWLHNGESKRLRKQMKLMSENSRECQYIDSQKIKKAFSFSHKVIHAKAF